MKTLRSKRYDHITLGEHFRINLFRLSYDDKVFISEFEYVYELLILFFNTTHLQIPLMAPDDASYYFFKEYKQKITTFIHRKLKKIVMDIRKGKEINEDDKKLYLLCLPKVGNILL